MSTFIAVPVECACGGRNFMYDDLMRNRTVVRCECGTRLEIDNDEWWESIERQRKANECK